MVLRVPTAAGHAAIRPQRTGYAVSHDGIVWEKPALRLFEFDGDGGANNICVENIGRVVKDGRISLYYAGQDRSWTSWPPQNAPDGRSVRAGATRHTQTGLATLPVDRFTAIGTASSGSPSEETVRGRGEPAADPSTTAAGTARGFGSAGTPDYT